MIFIGGLFLTGVVLLLRSLLRRLDPSKIAEHRFKQLLAINAEDDAPTNTTSAKPRPSVRLRDWLAARMASSRLAATAEGKDIETWISQQLVLAGLVMTPAQAAAVAILCALASVLLFLLMIAASVPLLLLPVPLLVVAYPFLKLRSLKQQRSDIISSEIIWVIQELAMALGTGALSIDAALSRVAARAKFENTPLLLELRRAVQRHQTAGIRRETALQEVADRTQVVAVRTFIDSLITGLSTGSPMHTILAQYQKQAQEQWRNDMDSYIERQTGVFTIALVLTMFGGLILYAGAMVLPSIVG